MTYDQILSALTDRKLSMVAKRAKIHRNTLSNMVARRVIPNNATLEVLSRYLDGTAYEPDTESAE